MARVTVVGSVNLDTVYGLAALPQPGQTLLATSTQAGPGGKGGNQAVAAARAGATVQMVAAIGDDDHGRRLRAHLDANGVGLDGVIALPVASGSAVILVDQRSGENMIVVAPGANAHLRLDSPHLRALVADCDVLLLQLEIPLETALAAARGARAGGATVLLNASPLSADQSLAELAAEVDVVIVNEDEGRIWRWPVSHLVTTRGARGRITWASTVSSRSARPRWKRSTPAGPVMCSPGCWRPAGPTIPGARCAEPARRAHWRHWSTGPGTVRRPMRRSRTR